MSQSPQNIHILSPLRIVDVAENPLLRRGSIEMVGGYRDHRTTKSLMEFSPREHACIMGVVHRGRSSLWMYRTNSDPSRSHGQGMLFLLTSRSFCIVRSGVGINL